MTMKIKLTLFFLLFSLMAFSHSGKPKYHVIIDTDGAVDDMRAISMLLSGNEIRVLAITCSQGTLLPHTVYSKVKLLLFDFHHNGIKVGISDAVDFKLPEWSKFAESVLWGNSTIHETEFDALNSTALLNQTLKGYPEKITLIALGSLKTYADWLKLNPQMIHKIDRIIWYNNHNIPEGFNYSVSPESFNYIKGLGVNLEIVANSSDLMVNNNYSKALDTLNSIYARQIVFVNEQISNNHQQLWDDLLPLYLNVPILFDIADEGNIKFVSLPKSLPDNFVYDIINELLVSSAQANTMVFVRFPTDTLLYKPEYAKSLKTTLYKYGASEWKAITLTNEIHGHTGIYSIIGAKMGMRVLDYFNVGVNNLFVTSFAGFTPPLSCLNDGIQISTGATLGQGLIAVSDSVSNIPSAIFEFNGQKIKVSVKEEIVKQMQKDILFGVKTCGSLTDRYWLYVEELAIKYWSDFDRNLIFDITTIK